MRGDEDGERGEATALRRRIPNALTWSRVVMTVVFVAVLSVYRFPDQNAWALPVGLALFVAAALTDALDGWLARRWGVVSTFGRIVDPLADKVLVLGAFVMLTGIAWSGVAAWMAVVILGRELLVTTIRGVLEGKGIDFSAIASGKAKMIVQSIGVPMILCLLIWMDLIMDVSLLEFHRLAELSTANPERFGDLGTQALLHDDNMERMGRVILLHASSQAVAFVVTVVTAWSAIPYLRRAVGSIGATRGGRDG